MADCFQDGCHLMMISFICCYKNKNFIDPHQKYIRILCNVWHFHFRKKTNKKSNLSLLFSVRQSQSGGNKKKSSRRCGKCDGCHRKEDCSTCDFCKVRINMTYLGLRSTCSSRSIGRREVSISHGHWSLPGLL